MSMYKFITARRVVSLPRRLIILILICLLWSGVRGQEKESYMLDSVTVTWSQARNFFKELGDVRSLLNNYTVLEIARDSILVNYMEGFKARNEIDMMTVSYIYGEQLWERVFGDPKHKQFEQASGDLVKSRIVFERKAPKTNEGYYVYLEVKAGNTRVYEMFNMSEAEFDSVVNEHAAVLGTSNTIYTDPGDAHESVIQALIGALAEIEGGDVPINIEPAYNGETLVVGMDSTGTEEAELLVVIDSVEIQESALVLEENNLMADDLIDNLDYSYFIAHEDVWLRNPDEPGVFISPIQKAVLGTRTALLEDFEIGSSSVAKIRIKDSGDTIIISKKPEYLVRIEPLPSEVSYMFSENYISLKLPYSEVEATKAFRKYEKARFDKSCGSYFKAIANESHDEVEGQWVADFILRNPVSDTEISMIENNAPVMSSQVSGDYLRFVEDFKKDGYFTGDKEPLTWMEEQGLNDNEIVFLGMKVSKIITPFKEVLEETEKNLVTDYPIAYQEILNQYSGGSVLGQAQIRYINNSCTCNPSNHSLGAAIDMRPAFNPQITALDQEYIVLIKYLTGLDLTKPKTAKQVTDAQEIFMMKIHGQKTKKYDLEDIIADYEDVNSMTNEFAQLAQLKDKSIEISKKADLIEVLKAYKARVIFGSDGKKAIDDMVTHLQAATTNTIAKKTITNWDKVVAEKKAFLEMVKNAGFTGLDKFIEYFGEKDGRLDYFNILLQNGFGETRIELINSFHKAHRTLSQKYNGMAEDGEWGGLYRSKYDGMHFGLRTSFIKSLTNKK